MGTAESKNHHRHRHHKTELSADYKCRHQSKQKSSTMKSSLHGSILNHSFPKQDQNQSKILHQVDQISYDYLKNMQRVDEENRPVLEGLCPETMYVSTNDIRICDTQRLPPPLRCKMSQAHFRPVSPTKVHKKKSSFL